MMLDYQTLMLPLMKLTNDKKVHKFRKVIEILAEYCKSTEEEKDVLLPNENQTLLTIELVSRKIK